MLSGSAELDFRFLSAGFLAGMHTCYLKLKLSTSAAKYVAFPLSCKALLGQAGNPEFRWKRSLEHSLSTQLHDSLELQEF